MLAFIMTNQLVKNENTNELITPKDWHSALLNGGNLILSQEGYESLKNNGFDIIINLYELRFYRLG